MLTVFPGHVCSDCLFALAEISRRMKMNVIDVLKYRLDFAVRHVTSD